MPIVFFSCIGSDLRSFFALQYILKDIEAEGHTKIYVATNSDDIIQLGKKSPLKINFLESTNDFHSLIRSAVEDSSEFVTISDDPNWVWYGESHKHFFVSTALSNNELSLAESLSINQSHSTYVLADKNTMSSNRDNTNVVSYELSSKDQASLSSLGSQPTFLQRIVQLFSSK